jgi:hypothetical protein
LTRERHTAAGAHKTTGTSGVTGNGDGVQAPVLSGGGVGGVGEDEGKAGKKELPPGWIEMWSRTKNRPYYKYVWRESERAGEREGEGESESWR